MWLWRNPGTVQDCIEARVGAQWIEPRANCHKKQFVPARALLVRFFEPRQGLVLSAQICIRFRKEERIRLLPPSAPWTISIGVPSPTITAYSNVPKDVSTVLLRPTRRARAAAMSCAKIA